MSSASGTTPTPPGSLPPEAWAPARAAARRLLSPVERFLSIEASSGLVLLAAAAVALGLASSPWRDAFAGLWHTPIGLRLGPFAFERDLHFWINDGLMTIFFFVVGLEIRREMHGGELSEVRRAALPVFAAVGGMLAPAAIYLAFDAGRATAGGWGVPMATDIAFAVGVLALLGKRVPPAMRILLLALAVIDDVGAILVIAIFYTSGFEPSGLALVAAGIGLILGMQKVGARHSAFYVPAAVLVWAGALVTGVHPTLAGVIVGLLTPARAWLGPATFAEHATEVVGAVREEATRGNQGTGRVLSQLDDLGVAQREAVSPVERLQHALHGWVAFVIMPLFALANAGVSLGGAEWTADTTLVFVGVLAGLVLGKPIGVVALSYLATRVGLASLPRGVGLRELVVVGVVAGIGFTMALFIAALAFPKGAALETSKLAILGASGVAGVLGLLAGRVLLPAQPIAAAAATAHEAERSAEL